MVFTQGFLEVAIESWPECDLCAYVYISYIYVCECIYIYIYIILYI